MKRTMLFLGTVCCFLSTGISTGMADVKLAAVFGDNMVLQQKTRAPIWGWAQPGEKVTVKGSWGGFAKSARADKNGKWSVKIRTPKPGGPYTLTVRGGNTVTLENVMIGEVWICSGQSNMEMPVRGWPPRDPILNSEREIKAAKFPKIRLFTVQKAVAFEPKEDCTGAWVECSPETVGAFSATGYFFGRELHGELDIPIGLISTNWGGTVAEAWTRKEALAKKKAFAPIMDRLQQTARNQDDRQRAQKEYEKKQAQWMKVAGKADRGTKDGDPVWAKPDMNDSEWKTMILPRQMESGGVGNLDGVVWFRKTIEIPSSWVGKELLLEIGAVDDMDITWVNGTKVGEMMTAGAWNTPRRYKVPASAVTSGRNVVAVRVLDTGGQGGMYLEGVPMQIRPAGQSDTKPIALSGQWRYRVGYDMKDLPPRPQAPRSINPNMPTALYNGMIAPLIPCAIRGAIWYQGESNRTRAYQYRKLFPNMIENWRDDWGRGAFPFYFVQIAPFDYGETAIGAELKEAQMMALSLRNTGMAVTMDIGNTKNIHPANKQDVGKRLALWALAKTYGRKDLVYSGPLYKSMKVEGDKIRLSFRYVGGGLAAKDGGLKDFTIAGGDKVFHPAKAVIDGETIVVSSAKVDKPVSVRYAWSATAEASLFNKEGLPASPFRTDDWPGATFDAK